MSDVDTATNAIALEIIESGAGLPPLPAAGAQLLALAQQRIDDIDVDAFTRLVESDPALCAKVLQLANSSYYSTVSKVVSLRQAIMKIGLEETINAAYWFFCQSTLPGLPAMEGFSGKDYWAHSWACAVANRMLGRPDIAVKTLPGELYVAGLLHGIGKLILAVHRPDDFLRCIRNSRDFSQPLEQAEKEIFGTTDSLIAYRVMKSWQLPANICAAVKYYVAPQSAEPEYREIAALTQFAYFIGNTSGIGNSGDEFCYDLSQTWLCQDDASPLYDEALRQRLVQEIYAVLQKKSEDYTGVAPSDGDSSGQTAAETPADRTGTSAGAVPPRKKGIMAGIKSFLGLKG